MRAIVPIKKLSSAKTRLSPILTPKQRLELMQAMACDVLSVLTKMPEIEQVCVVSDDPWAGSLVARFGVCWWHESELSAAPGLNSVILGAINRVAREACKEALIVHADLPLLDGASVASFINAWRAMTGNKRLALSGPQDGGTSLLLIDPAHPLAFFYGPDSLALHAAQAQALGYSAHIQSLGHAVSDVDRPADLARLFTDLRPYCGPHTERMLDAFRRACLRRSPHHEY